MNKKVNAAVESWIKAVSKMPVGRSYEVPFYGRLRAYRAKSGKRVFALSDSPTMQAGGNLPLKVVLSDIKHVLFY